MKNILTTTEIFDARECFNNKNAVSADCGYPFTFLLSHELFLTSSIMLPQHLINKFNHMFDHGVGYATRAEAETARKQIDDVLAESDLCALVHRLTCNVKTPRRYEIQSIDLAFALPMEALNYIRKQDAEIDPSFDPYIKAHFYTATQRRKTENVEWLLFAYCVSCRYDIRIAQYITQSMEPQSFINSNSAGIQ